MNADFDYIKGNSGIDTEESYPYEARDNDCRFNPCTVGATCSGYVDIMSGDEKALQEAMASIGPVSVAIDSGHTSFQFYETGWGGLRQYPLLVWTLVQRLTSE
ncbi:digestive cysteine proteinase 2 isoform X2 [Ictalurus furcatus]|uniref:digestive cysteine proteinase 2 isoform X2 n=1 Tax=Ictalurus furcatus TaxID=66913 RepID=UPI0023507BF4|nr:digestive cysteine proteinase 2 isoform X2 [Ictalurus furcatus]